MIGADQMFDQIVSDEYHHAVDAFGADFASDHEAFAVLLEEVEEIKAWVWKKRNDRDRRAMIEELAQISAVCKKWALSMQHRMRPPKAEGEA
jgi:hypothetical protein